MANRRRVGPIAVTIPSDAVLAVRSSAQASRDGISDDYEGYRHKGREYEDLARRRGAEMTDLAELLAQLGDNDEQPREVTADHDTLHGVLGDVLMDEIRQLAVDAGNYWRHEGSIANIDRQVAVVQKRLLLLREVQHAADQRRADDRDDDPDQSS